MKWFIMLVVFIGGLCFLINKREDRLREDEHRKTVAEQERIRAVSEAPLPEKSDKNYTMRFSQQTIRTLRALAVDPNEQVRFASVELLWQLQDEQAPALMKRMFREETDAEAKKRLIEILAKEKSRLSLTLLALPLEDYEKSVRLKAIDAISSFPARESVAMLTRSMQDYDEEVRLKSVEAANKIKRDIEANRATVLQEIEKKPLFKVE